MSYIKSDFAFWFIVTTNSQIIKYSFFGKKIVYQNVDLDVETLTEISRKTGGKFFNATNLEELNEIEDKIINNDVEKKITPNTINERFLLKVRL